MPIDRVKPEDVKDAPQPEPKKKGRNPKFMRRRKDGLVLLYDPVIVEEGNEWVPLSAAEEAKLRSAK